MEVDQDAAAGAGEIREKRPKLTKKEMRDKQEQERKAKAERIAAGLPANPKKVTDSTQQKGTGKGATAASVASPPSSGQATGNPSPGLVGEKKEKEKDKNKELAKKSADIQNQVPWLTHLDVPKTPDTTHPSIRDLHPAVLALGLQFASYKIAGANARCVAMLTAFRRIIQDHIPPSNTTLVRNLQKHLDPHISYLLSIRPMSITLRECIRWLKKEIVNIVEEETPLTDEDARGQLTERIEHFIRDRITVADRLIVQYALTKIVDGDVILTYARSSIVQAVLIAAHQRKPGSFRVIIADASPLLEGKALLKRLVAAGISCTYVLLPSLSSAMKEVTKVFLGAHALLNNGALLARVGTSLVAMRGKAARVPVLVVSETYKFVNRSQVDSFVLNEIGNPDALIYTTHRPTPSTTTIISDTLSLSPPSLSSAPLANWREDPNLRLLNLIYDVTPSSFLTLVITEVGMIPCTSAPVIWREYNEEFRRRTQIGR